MSKDKLNSIYGARNTAKIKFEKSFQDAKTPQELLQAYATYVGALEGLLDTIEICEKEKLRNDNRTNR